MKALIFEGSYGRSKVGHVQHSFQGAYLFEVRSRDQWQKIRKRNAKWNEFKGELNAILNIVAFLPLADEATHYQ